MTLRTEARVEIQKASKKKTAKNLKEPVVEARNLSRKLGLEPYPVKYWVVDYDEMNQAVAYGGFQERYPHWRWGMQYDKQKKQRQFAGGKVYEIVINDNPAHAYLQESNDVADQKAVITHVEAHSDFFANNKWYKMMGEGINSAAMLARHAKMIEGYMEDPDIGRDEVERWIDNILCIEDNVDQHGGLERLRRKEEEDDEETDDEEIFDKLDEIGVSEEVKGEVFDDEWLEKQKGDNGPKNVPEEPEKDLLWFLREHGKQYDDDAGKAVEMEEWQREILDVLRKESYYFAPQKMTKVMNEGWAAYWESVMMGEEKFAGDDEFINYADHQARVLGSPGLNPYKLGKEMWEYIENKKNREEVVEKILRVEGVDADNFFERIDFDHLEELLEPEYPLDAITEETLDDLAELDDSKLDEGSLDAAMSGEIEVKKYPWKVLSYEGLAERHFSLNKPQNRGFIREISRDELEEIDRYLLENGMYESIEEAIEDVDYTTGWEAMHEIRATNNDVTFLDSYLTQEFVTKNNYFAYEYSHATSDFRVSSTDYEDVKKKLMLRFTNFGKPTIKVHDANYDNAGELLLAHHYNGVMLNLDKARETMERIHKMWGRPVNLKTIIKKIDDNVLKMAKRRGQEPELKEQGVMIRYDGDGFETRELDWEEVEEIEAEELDYDTKPEEWL